MQDKREWAGAEPVRERAWPLLALMAGGWIFLFAATLLLPHNPYIRYQQLLPTIQNMAVWGFERTEFDDTPIDVAVIGNSRLQAAVRAPDLQRALSENLGSEIHVANLSMPQEGRDSQYVIAKRLLVSHPETKLLILSVIEAMPRESHPAFRNIADAEDVVGAPMLVNRSYFDNLFILPYRQMSLFVQGLAPEAFGVSPGFDRAAYAGTDRDMTKSFTTPLGDFVDRDSVHSPKELLPSARERIASITPPVLPGVGEGFEFAVERTYTDKIARLARANGTRVAFLYTPIYSSTLPIPDRAFYEQYGTILEAGFLADKADFYSDYGHLNRQGSAAMTDWLARELAAQEAMSSEPHG